MLICKGCGAKLEQEYPVIFNGASYGLYIECPNCKARTSILELLIEQIKNEYPLILKIERIKLHEQE